MEKIDFVVLWVDGSDKEWLSLKNKYSGKKENVANSIMRYRDYEILKYWFRGVEKFAPWVNRIHFVTCGHLPSWLNTNNPKLNIVKHKDFIPKEYLPTFNSHTIELNIHRIQGLSEKFVYFNDDMMLVNAVSSEYFFKKGLPCDSWQEDILVLDKTSDINFSHILINDLKVINSNFNKREAIKNYFFKWFNLKNGRGLMKNVLLYSWKNVAGFHNYHMPTPYLKETFNDVWSKEQKILDETCITKFREDNDVNQYVMSLWQIYSGKFYAKKSKEFGKCFTLKDNNEELYKFIKNSSKSIVCINDGVVHDFEKVKKELNSVFEYKFPKKSNFEK